jgi:hypothetical protein
MPRIRRPFERPIGKLRDARLTVISTEDTDATRAYFAAMTSPRYYQNPKVYIGLAYFENIYCHIAKMLKLFTLLYFHNILFRL